MLKELLLLLIYQLQTTQASCRKVIVMCCRCGEQDYDFSINMLIRAKLVVLYFSI